MQDNFKSNSSGFQDHGQASEKGWAAMQQLLDKEMPVGENKKKRRGAFIWWFNGSAAVLFLLLFLWLGTQKLPLEKKQSTALGELFVELESEQFEGTSDLGNGGNDNGNGALENTNHKRVQRNSILPVKKLQNQVDEEKKDIGSISETEREQVFNERDTGPSSEGAIKKDSKSTFLALERKMLLVSSMPLFPEATPEVEPIRKAGKLRKLALDVQSGAGFIDGSFPRLFQGGTRLVYAINDQWSVHLGAQFTSFQKTFRSTNNVIEVLEAADTLVVVEEGQTPTNVFTNRFNIENERTFRFSYLQVPVGGAYQFHPNWRIFGEVQASLLIRERELETSSKVTSGTFMSLEAERDVSGDSGDVQPFKKLSFWASGGIAYTLPIPLEIRLQYAQSLGKLNDANFGFQSLVLGLGYRF